MRRTTSAKILLTQTPPRPADSLRGCLITQPLFPALLAPAAAHPRRAGADAAQDPPHLWLPGYPVARTNRPTDAADSNRFGPRGDGCHPVLKESNITWSPSGLCHRRHGRRVRECSASQSLIEPRRPIEYYGRTDRSLTLLLGPHLPKVVLCLGRRIRLRKIVASERKTVT